MVILVVDDSDRPQAVIVYLFTLILCQCSLCLDSLISLSARGAGQGGDTYWKRRASARYTAYHMYPETSYLFLLNPYASSSSDTSLRADSKKPPPLLVGSLGQSRVPKTNGQE